MRQWLRELIRGVIREEIHAIPLIIAARPPREEDVYEKGTLWKHGEDKYIAKEVRVKWTRT